LRMEVLLARLGKQPKATGIETILWYRHDRVFMCDTWQRAIFPRKLAVLAA